MKLLLLWLMLIGSGFLTILQASEVKLMLMDWYGNPIKLDPNHIKIDVNGEFDVPFEVVQSQIRVAVKYPDNAKILIRVMGFRQKSIMLKCDEADSPCTVGAFLEVATTVEVERSGKLKTVVFPESWKNKGEIFVSMFFLGSSRRIEFVLESTNSSLLPLEEYGLASITAIFKDGTKAAMLYAFNAYDARVEIQK